jgi:hypothetical protein
VDIVDCDIVWQWFIIDGMNARSGLSHPRSNTLLLSGIPASLKSTYAGWLEREKGFSHLDFDELLWGKGQQRKLRSIDTLQRSIPSFIEETRRRALPTVMDWGFPSESLQTVGMFKEAGAELWWFDGNRQAARVSFINRARETERLTGEFLHNRIREFDKQISFIEQAWPLIKLLFQPHIIKTVKRGPTYMQPEEIFHRMFGSTQV